MAFNRDRLFTLAATALKESRHLDFKREFEPGSNQAWCELIKDIVAFANTGGGVVVLGVEDNGQPSDVDCSAVLACDIADITNKIFKYTGVQFADIEVGQVERADATVPFLMIAPTDAPIVFTKPGTYDIGEGKQKTAFSQGTVYFRHGAKSETGNHDDLTRWRDRELTKHRQSLLRGMRKVVEAPPDHAVVVVPAGSLPDADLASIAARITTDPSATKVSVRNTDELWPYRQKELLAILNERLPDSPRVTGHDLLCVNKSINAINDHPEFIHKPHKMASPQYSGAYADWIVAQVSANAGFFADCRQAYREKHAG